MSEAINRTGEKTFHMKSNIQITIFHNTCPIESSIRNKNNINAINSRAIIITGFIMSSCIIRTKICCLHKNIDEKI